MLQLFSDYTVVNAAREKTWPCFVPWASYSTSDNCWLLPFVLMENSSPCSWNDLQLDVFNYTLHSKVTWFHFQAAWGIVHCPFQVILLNFFTNQFRTVGKAQITAADPRWALALFPLLLMMHLLVYFWYIIQLMCLGTCTSLRYGVLHLTHYTNNITENFIMVFLSKKYAINHALSKYFIIVNSPCCYTLFTSYTENAFNNLYESLACYLLTY